MDPKISQLIIEFLVRELDDDQVLDRIIAMLPVPEDDFQLKKALLLRRIQTELNSATVSEKLLDLMEFISELDFGEGRVVSETMKAAYCAVAVHCTVRFLEDLESNGKYMEILRNFWRIRVQKIVLSENSELISEELWSWKDNLESAISDVVLRGKILSRNTKNEAIKAVEGFLAVAWDDLGPSYLETIAEDVIKTAEDTAMPYDLMLASMDERISGGRPAEDGGKAGIENDMLVEEPNQAHRHVSEIPRTANMLVSARITGDGPSGNGDDTLVTHGSDQSLSLHGTTTDICPETEKIADLVEREEDTPEVSRVQEGLGSGNKQSPGKKDETPADSSLEDLRDASPGDSTSQHNLRPPKIRKTAKRWWTPLEEDTLRSGVKQFGQGNWKLILDAYPDVFQGRTEAGLQGKWRRNMVTRRSR